MIQWKKTARKHGVEITPASFSDGGGTQCRGYLLSGFLCDIQAAILDLRRQGDIYTSQTPRGVHVCKF